MRTIRAGFAHLAKYLVVYVPVILILLPLANILISGFKTNSEVVQALKLWPSSFYLGNFIRVFQNRAILFSFVNSLSITAVAIAVSIFLSSLAAYPISRIGGKGYKLVYFYFLSAMMIPAASNLATLYSIMLFLGLKNTRIGLALVYAAFQIPTGILFYTSFLKTIPRALDEAAAIDGCTFLQRFYVIIFPLLRPVTFTFSVLSSLAIWNDFLMPLLFISSPLKKPVTLMIFSFLSQFSSEYGPVYAIMILAVVPPIVLFAFNRKVFMSGIMAGSLKG